MSSSAEKSTLTTLPSELRLKIFQYVLPELGPTTTWDHYTTVAAQYKQYRAVKFREKDRPWIMGRPRRNHYSILRVSKHINADIRHLMHCQSFQVSVREGPDAMERILADLRCQAAGITDKTSWLPTFPGLDLGQVRDFTIYIVPSDWPHFWRRASSACEDLCSHRLLQSSPLQKLSIVIADLNISVAWELLAAWSYSGYQQKPIHAVFEHYESMLQTFAEVAALANQCEVHLPKWIDYCQSGKRCLLEEWEGKIGARVFFDAATPDEGEALSASEEQEYSDLMDEAF